MPSGVESPTPIDPLLAILKASAAPTPKKLLAKIKSLPSVFETIKPSPSVVSPPNTIPAPLSVFEKIETALKFKPPTGTVTPVPTTVKGNAAFEVPIPTLDPIRFRFPVRLSITELVPL